MTASDLLKFHKAFCEEAYDLCEHKNHDYAGSTGETPFRNFESIESLGLAKTEMGLLIRMTDKINRLATYVKCGKLRVANEGALDSLIDLINYSVLLAAYIKQEGWVEFEKELLSREDWHGK